MASSNPRFFDYVDQFLLETHLSRKWAPDPATFLEYARLLGLLLRSGFVLRDAELAYCSGGEAMGVVELALSSGYFRRNSLHCENLLFVRNESDQGVGVVPPPGHLRGIDLFTPNPRTSAPRAIGPGPSKHVYLG